MFDQSSFFAGGPHKNEKKKDVSRMYYTVGLLNYFVGEDTVSFLKFSLYSLL